MPKLFPGKHVRAIALYMVLGTLIVVVILAQVVVRIILNQASLSRHSIARIQAYYAAQAGMNYALEQLRTGAWKLGVDCAPASPCDISESEFPSSILSFGTGSQKFRVIFCPSGSACAPSLTVCDPPADSGYNYCINISVKYTSPEIPENPA